MFGGQGYKEEMESIRWTHNRKPQEGQRAPQLTCLRTRTDTLPARRLRLRLHRQGDRGEPGHQGGPHDRGRALHLHRGRVPGRLRQRAHGADQRRLLRGPDARDHQEPADRAEGERRRRQQDPQAGPHERPPDVREQRRPDDAAERALRY